MNNCHLDLHLIIMHVFRGVCYMEVRGVTSMMSLKRENELAEIRMITWMFDVKLREKLYFIELRQ